MKALRAILEDGLTERCDMVSSSINRIDLSTVSTSDLMELNSILDKVIIKLARVVLDQETHIHEPE